jgi:hypothetical protein
MNFSRETIKSNQPLYTFKPEENITVHELAQLLPFLSAAWRNAAVNELEVERGELPPGTNPENLPEPLRRHFQKTQ